MNKPVTFKILYYICFAISAFLWFNTSNLINVFGIGIKTSTNALLAIVNLVLVIIFSFKLIKKDLKKINILFPIIYLIFLIIIVIITHIMNNKLMIPNIHFGYYLSFILFNYLLLNLYSVLSFSKNN